MMNSKARILVVDDDPDLLNINSSILQSSGLEVIEAGTGNECISIAREILPDVILLDVNLPDTNDLTSVNRSSRPSPGEHVCDIDLRCRNFL